MSRKLLVLVPLYTPPKDCETIKKYLLKYTWEGTTIDVIGTSNNFAVNSRAEKDYAVPEVLDLMKKAENNGYDAIISYCYCDVGVERSYELVNIPVIGPFISSLVMVNLLAQKFSILSTEFPLIKGMKRAPFGPADMRDFGIGNYISTRHIPFEKFFVFSGDPEKVKIMKEALSDAGMRAISDGAQALMLACTGFLIDIEELVVPVINSTVSLKMAEALVDLKKGKSPYLENIESPKIKIKVLIPNSKGFSSESKNQLNELINFGTELTFLSFDEGPNSLNSYYDSSRTSHFILKETFNAKNEGYDAVIIGSYDDHCLESAREVSHIPVIGLGCTSMLFTLMFGESFSIITDKNSNLIKKLARRGGVEDRLLDVANVSMEESIESFLKASKDLSDEGAQTLILGYYDAMNLADALSSKMKIPVLDPMKIAVKTAEILVSLRLSQSKIFYPYPALPDYHKERLKKLKNLEKISDKLDPSMFLYEEDN